MKAKLFQYAVILHPTGEEEKKGGKSQIILDLKTMLASDEKTAVLLVGRQIPEEYLSKLDQIEIAIRPF